MKAKTSSDKFKVNKLFILILIDIIICNISIFISMYLRLGYFYPLFDISSILLLLSSILLIGILFFFDIYKSLNRYAGWDTFIQLGKALIIYDLLFFSICTLIGIAEVPRTIGIIHPIILTSMIILSRIFIRIFLGDRLNQKNVSSIKERVLIYGAGIAGRQLANTVMYSKKMQFLGFLEDNNKLIGNKINNKIIYDAKKLNNIKTKLKINTILLAIPSLSNSKKSVLLKTIQKNKLAVKTLPTLSELENNNVTLDDLRPININELLGRSVVDTSFTLKKNYLNDSIVLVTGAGGSIGSELCKQILEQNPSKLVILDSSEFNLYKIHQELLEKFIKKINIRKNIIPILASVQNIETMEYIFTTHTPDVIYHAAAYKHVPLVQSNPIEGIRNNVFGTKILSDLAIKYKTKKFVLISSDKAVRPTNVMGASKRLAELYLQSLNIEPQNTIFTIVRFGNVIGSSGSVIPKFSDQIQKGGPITLTHKNIIRFFMTAREAIHLIIQAGYLAKGGEVFILKMGNPVKIYELAKKMIFLSGKTIMDKNNLKGDIEIIITGLRPGEKLYEEVLINNNPIPTSNKMILKANEVFFDKSFISTEFSKLQVYMKERNINGIDIILKKLISGYENKDLKR